MEIVSGAHYQFVQINVPSIRMWKGERTDEKNRGNEEPKKFCSGRIFIGIFECEKCRFQFIFCTKSIYAFSQPLVIFEDLILLRRGNKPFNAALTKHHGNRCLARR